MELCVGSSSRLTGRSIRGEFRQLSAHDASRLTTAMGQYQKDLGTGYMIKNYGDGLMMITDSGRGQGRCLFFKADTNVDSKTGELEEQLTALLIYKKESQQVPERVLKTAWQRMEGR